MSNNHMRIHNMNAWILTWEGTEGPANIPKLKLIAILSAKKNTNTVKDMISLIYSRNICSAKEMAFYANKQDEQQRHYNHMYSTSTRIFYGHNPCIFARIVSGLSIEHDDTNQEERIRWIEPAYMKIETSGTPPIAVEPDKACELVRPICPLYGSYSWRQDADFEA